MLQTVVWTGRELVVWGGAVHTPGRPGHEIPRRTEPPSRRLPKGVHDETAIETLGVPRAGRGGPRPVCGTRAGKPLAAHQEPRGIGNLVVPGDRVEIVYTLDTPRVRSPMGTLYVRNDLQRHFVALPLKLQGRTTLQTAVPARLIRGHKLLYYAVLRDPRSGRSVTVPARGAGAQASAFVLGNALVVRLGTHRFDHQRAPEAIVAHAGPAEVGFEDTQEFHFGPQTFLVGRDRSIWLSDGLNKRLLGWRAGQPDTVGPLVAAAVLRRRQRRGARPGRHGLRRPRDGKGPELLHGAGPAQRDRAGALAAQAGR